jgi:hypothetical protein
VTVGAALDAATVVGVVADVPDALAELPAVVVDDLDDAEEDVDELDEVAVACFAVVAAVPVAPAWAESPAIRPVPVRAPASDHLVRCLIRRRPASRSLRLLAFWRSGRAAWLFMATIVDHGPKCRLGRR